MNVRCVSTTDPAIARVVSPAPRQAWKEVWETSSEATVFHRPEWIDACCRVGRFEDISRLYEWDDGQRILCPLVRRRVVPGGWSTALSTPRGWGFGGAFGSRRLGPKEAALILNDLLRLSPQVIINPGPVSGAAWSAAHAPARVRHDTHVVDLRRGFDHLWSRRFSSDTRNKIRKAEKRGVEVQWAPTSQLLAVHWDLFMRWTAQQARERGIPKPLAVALGRRRESLARYEAIARGLGDSCQVALARVDGQPAASAIVLFGRVHAHYWRATSDRALVDRRYANHLLLARIIEYAAANGCRYLQMGESGGKRSLVEFKERFAATPVSYDELRFAPLGVTLATRGRDLVIRAAMSGGVKAAVWWKRRGTLRH